MKDSDRAKIRKLRGISDVALRLFVVTGIASMAIAILGSFLVSVIVGKEWVRIAVAISAFGGGKLYFLIRVSNNYAYPDYSC
jgi:Na+/glutamate symporter